MQASFALFERIFQYLDLEHEIVDKPGAKTLERVRGQVALRNVWFHYEEPELYQRDGTVPSQGAHGRSRT